MAELKGKSATEVEVPVIGGHSGVTILPLLSQIPGVSFSDQEIADLTKRIQNAGTEVVEAKAGGGSATLSMGGCPFWSLSGSRHAGEKAWWSAPTWKATATMRVSSPAAAAGENGVEERQSIGKLSAFEQQALEGMLDTLKKDIALGEDFVNK